MKFSIVTTPTSKVITADKLQAGELAEIVEPKQYAGYIVMRYGNGGHERFARDIIALNHPSAYWDGPEYISVRRLDQGTTVTLTQE